MQEHTDSEVVIGRSASSARRSSLVADVRAHFAGRRNVILGLLGLAFLVYGFELFNFNLTIDEEIHAASFDPEGWVAQRRWGMYVVNRVLLPYTVVPTVPLAIGLGLHFLGVLVLLKAWDIVDATDQFLVGALAIATPTMAYMYTFDTIGYGMGVGLFAAALSLALFRRFTGSGRYLAAIPAGFALAIYQTFGLALICVFVVGLVLRSESERAGQSRSLLHVAGVGLAAVALYAAGQAIFMTVLNETRSDYLEQFIDLDALRERTRAVVRAIASTAASVYRGDASVYGHAVWALPILILMLFASFAVRIASSDIHRLRRLVLLAAFPFVAITPFLGGLLSGGNVALRFLVALPFALAGLMALGLSHLRRARMVIAVIAGFVLLQFAVASNSLFGASHLALQQDRALATRLIYDIEAEMSQAATPPLFLEIVGVPARGSSPLVPESETFGASFFEWEGGNVNRIVLFLRTIGFDRLSGLSTDQRDRFVFIATTMPAFPAEGSVVVEGDVVVVKFGPYTNTQTATICRDNPDVSICSP